MARRPNAVAVAANRIVVAGMKPPPSPMMRDQRGEAAEDEHDRLRVDGFRARANRRASAMTKLPTASSDEPAATTIGIAFGPTP